MRQAVIGETAFHLRDCELVSQMVEIGLVNLAFDLEPNRPEIATQAHRYASRRPDLADLCLIRLSELPPACRSLQWMAT